MIRRRLFEQQDIKLRDFSAGLVPDMPRDAVIGVRVPTLRKLAAEYKKADMTDFLCGLPHKYHEENVLHAIMISGIKDFADCMEKVESFLPYINNWAVCDTLIPKVFAKNKPAVLERVKVWLKADQKKYTYTVRFGTGVLMRWFLDDDFSTEYAELAASVRSDEYYINMMTAWYFATALAKHYDAVLPFIEQIAEHIRCG